MAELNALGNIKLNEDYAVFSINPKVYSLDIVYSACYVMLDKAYIILDGDPEKEIKVEIRKKSKEQDLKELVYELNNHLISYSVYKQQSEKTKQIRELILHRAMFTHAPNIFQKVKDDENIQKENVQEEKKDNEDDKTQAK